MSMEMGRYGSKIGSKKVKCNMVENSVKMVHKCGKKWYKNRRKMMQKRYKKGANTAQKQYKILNLEKYALPF